MKKLIDKTEWKLFHPLYIALFIGIAIPDIDMIIMVYFLSKGFTATQVGIGLSLQSLFLLLSEIPTGAFADRFGKRKSVQMSWLMQSLIFTLFFFITDAWMMWVLFSLKGIAYTFSTGAFEALPYEIAKKAKRTDLINKFYKTQEFIYQIATMFSNLNVILFLFLLGAGTTYHFLGQDHQGMDFLWLTGSVGYLVGSIILSRLREGVKNKKTHAKENASDMFRMAKEAITYSKSHPVVSKLVAMGVFAQIVAALFSDIVYQPFLLDLGIKVESIAIIVAVGSFVAAAFTIIGDRIQKKVSTEKRYIELMLLAKIAILASLMFFAGPVYSIFFFFIYFGFDSFITPLLTPFKQHFYKKEIRATLGSVESVVKNITAVIFFPIVGLMLDNVGANKTVLFALLPLFLSYLIFRGIKHNGKLEH